MPQHRSYTTSVASVYPHYVTKAGKKSRTKDEVDQIICWLTGYSPEQLRSQLENDVDFQTFFTDAPAGVRGEEVEEPLLREIRYLDKLVDELAKGKAMEKILRG